MVVENLTLIHQWQRNLTQDRAKSEVMTKDATKDARHIVNLILHQIVPVLGLVPVKMEDPSDSL